ncbi:hypothetical protein [Raineyella fluvialis]|uniref:Uncharacterized protein n=1 Tax=Raineyella fluvialis TaxID=2662261 RepID=A0A5Q2FD91_9ACTN|nr:hypothetical protein [Raineyella fluvialis]QGF23394.1 hypothetical protein Rai3103_06640 [Raineyella fluvialis]
MKVLKWLLVLVGVAGLIGAGVDTYLSWYQLQKLLAVVASAPNAAQLDPTQEWALAIGLAAAGGLLLGIGLGMPRRSATRIRKQTLETSATVRDAEIRRRAVGTPPVTTERVTTDPARAERETTEPAGWPPAGAPPVEPTRDRHRRRGAHYDEEAGRGPAAPPGTTRDPRR